MSRYGLKKNFFLETELCAQWACRQKPRPSTHQSQGAQQALPHRLTPRKGYPLSARGTQNEPALHELAAQLPVIELLQAPPTVNLDYGSPVCHGQQVHARSREESSPAVILSL